MIDIHNGMTFEIRQPDVRKEVCVSLNKNADSNKYRLVVYFDGGRKTEDFFDSFYDAFDSFYNIVKTIEKGII